MMLLPPPFPQTTPVLQKTGLHVGCGKPQFCTTDKVWPDQPFSFNKESAPHVQHRNRAAVDAVIVDRNPFDSTNTTPSQFTNMSLPAHENVNTLPRLGSQSDVDVRFSIDVPRWASSQNARSPDIHVSEPWEITCFSRADDRTVKHGDRSQLLQFRDPPMSVDLGDGMDTFVSKQNPCGAVELILDELNRSGFDLAQSADVVTFRNNLNKIGGTPYNTRDDWELDAVMVGNTVFLDVRQTREDSTNEDQMRFSYYGYRFEALCTGVEKQPVNANSEFCSISRIRIADHRIVVSCEIDCTAGDPENVQNPLREYVELKTMRCIRSHRERTNMYRYRFPKYWLQSYLGGVRRISLGLRSEEGRLVEVKHIQVHEMNREAREHFSRINYRWSWDPFLSLNCIKHVLDHIVQACARASGRTVRVRFDPRTRRIEGFVVSSADQDMGSRVLKCLQKSELAKPESPADAQHQ